MIKRIVINASTVKISGGLYVTLDLIEAIIGQNDLEIKIICPDIPTFRKLDGKVNIRFVPNVFFRYINRPLLDFIWIPKEIKLFKPDLVVSLSNLPARTDVYQVFLHDNAFMSEYNFSSFHLSPRGKIIHSIRRLVFKNRLQFIDRIIVQTKLEKNKIQALFNNLPPIVVQAPLLPLHLKEIPSDKPQSTQNHGYIRIACISRYFEHKNIEVLYEAAKLCAKKNLPYQFILTIEEKQGKGAKQIIRKIENDNFENRIYNHGKVKRKNLVEFIQSVDAMILPSLIESYSLNYLEAWYMQKPIFVSDKAFSRGVCKQAACYFEPENSESIVACLEIYFSDVLKNIDIIRMGNENLRSLPSQENAIRAFLDVEKTLD